MEDHHHYQELYEEEVMWPESYAAKSTTTAAEQLQQYFNRSPERNIPSRNRHCGCEQEMEGKNKKKNKKKKEILVPPHELVSRRQTESEMAFSLCSGVGRTLKGRDLYYLRNSVLRMTGFIES